MKVTICFQNEYDGDDTRYVECDIDSQRQVLLTMAADEVTASGSEDSPFYCENGKEGEPIYLFFDHGLYLQWIVNIDLPLDTVEHCMVPYTTGKPRPIYG